MTETDPNMAARLDQDLQFQTLYAPAFYAGRREGHGRWCHLTAAGEDLGILWTDDDDGLGFAATTAAGIIRTPEFAQAFSAAKAAGTPASVVFDHYASLASQGLAAGPTTEGNLDTLPA